MNAIDIGFHFVEIEVHRGEILYDHLMWKTFTTLCEMRINGEYKHLILIT